MLEKSVEVNKVELKRRSEIKSKANMQCENTR